MINVDSAYRNACDDPNRVSYVIAKYGLYNKEAKGDISNVEGNSQKFSNVNKTYNEIKDTNFNYISCEPNRVKLNGSFYFVNNKNKENVNENIAYWSDKLSNEQGLFVGGNPKIIYIMSTEVELSDLTLYFQELCSEFKVTYYLNNVVVATKHVTNNTFLVPSTEGASAVSETKFNKLEIEFIKTGEPYRYIKFNEIDFGTINKFDSRDILDFDIIDELSNDSSELSSNSLNLRVRSENGEFDILNPNNKLKLLQEKQEITIHYYLKVGQAFREVPLGTFLLKKFSLDKDSLNIEAYDDTYFMNQLYYGSKFYNNVEITTILKDLFNYFNYTNYDIDKELTGIKLTGYIPIVEMREALRIIVEAGGCVVSKTRYGITKIFKTYDSTTKVFNRRLIFTESPQRNLFNNSIDMVKYSYDNVIENHEVYKADIEKPKDNIIIQFSDYPILEGTLEKAEISNDYDIVKSYATSCIINVKKPNTRVILKASYVKPTRIVISKRKSKVIGIEDYAISKVDNTLITESNVDSVAEWKLSRSEIRYVFDTPVVPYIEVGDTCKYETKYNTTNNFIVTRAEFGKSIIQNMEGE